MEQLTAEEQEHKNTLAYAQAQHDIASKMKALIESAGYLFFGGEGKTLNIINIFLLSFYYAELI